MPARHFLRIRASLAAASLVAGLSLAAGCGGDAGRGSVKGKVTVGGKPLPKGMITFLSEGGNKDPYSAAIVNGEYAIPDMPAAPARVYIVPPASNGPPPVDRGDSTPALRPGRQTRLVVPERYQNAQTSGLTLTVNKGENTFDADLVP
jgi:hypothetical protein